jgi:hypothetical protein
VLESVGGAGGKAGLRQPKVRIARHHWKQSVGSHSRIAGAPYITIPNRFVNDTSGARSHA